MSFPPFSAAMFPDAITCVKQAPGTSRRGGVVTSDGETTEMAAYVELATDKAVRSEVHMVPEGEQVYGVFTQGDPDLKVDDRVRWGAYTLSVVARPAPQGGGVVWRTWCKDVS